MANILDLIKGEGPAVSFIRGLVETTLSASEILRQLGDAGLGIRRQTGLALVAYLRDVAGPAGAYVQNLSLNSLPNLARLPNTLTNISTNFTYRLIYKGVNSFTGEPLEQRIQIVSNTLLTKQQAMDTGNAIIEGGQELYHLNEASGAVEDISINKAGIVV